MRAASGRLPSWAAAVLGLLTLTTPALGETVELACAPGSGTIGVYVSINLAASTATDWFGAGSRNGASVNHATITSTQVTWDDQQPGWVYHFNLDRANGTLTTTSANGQPTLYTCKKSTPVF
jgi:hypothetical protein